MRLPRSLFKYFLFGILSLVCQCVFAQTSYLSFKHLSLKEGLSQSPVFALLQDRKGFVWIGNREGLIRFDGYDFKKYVNKKIERQNTIHNDIRSIYEDTFGNLWIGTPTGVYQFDPQTENFTAINFGDVPLIFSIVPDGEKIWIATSLGLRLIDTRTKKAINLNIKGSGSEQVKNGWLSSLYLDKTHVLWVGSDKGVNCLNTLNSQTVDVPAGLTKEPTLSHARVFTIKEDHDGDLWLGTENQGLFWYQSRQGKCIHYEHDNSSESILSNFAHDVFVYDDENIWIGTRNGLNIFNKKTHRFTAYKHDGTDAGSLSHNTVWSFMKDDAGNIWLATYAGGINIYNPANSNFFNIGEKVNSNIGLNEPLVNAVLPAKNKNALWVGTDGGGLNYIDRDNGTVKVFSVKDVAAKRISNIVKALAVDGSGNVLAGTLDGLAIFDVNSEQLRYFNFFKDANPFVRVNALLTDSNGIWVGTEQGGLKLIRKDGSYTSFVKGGANGLTENYINALVKQGGNIWIGTRNGLNLLNVDNKKIESFFPQTGNASNSVILSLFVDTRNHLWVGSSNGLFIFEPNHKQFIRIGEKLLNNQVIQAITNDADGNIWVSTFNGLSKINHKKVTADYLPDSYQITNYTANDGLASNQFSLGAVASKNNEIFFGGVNGITSFFPSRLLENWHQPKVVITELMINNKSVSPYSPQSPLKQPIETTHSLTLDHDQNFISFRFAALSFLNAQNNQYAYKLDGLESHEGWHYAGIQRTANYTNLEPGDYVFRLKAANNDGVWSAGTTDIHIKVLPPFWKTWWAYIIYVLLFALAMYIVIRVISVRTKLERDLYYEHLDNERQQELNRMKLDFFTNISHELRTPLTLIVGPLENLLKGTLAPASQNEQLQLIKNNSDRLLKLVSELLDFRKAESGNMNIYVGAHNLISFLNNIFHSFRHMAAASNVEYEFVATEENIEVYFDDDQLEKVIYNLLANAFKFTPTGGKIVLKVTKYADTVEIGIANSGKGIPLDKQKKLFTNFYQVENTGLRNTGSGIGLALSKNIVDLHKGKIEVLSIAGEVTGQLNTCFTLSLKLGHSHFDETQLLPKSVIDNEHIYPVVANAPKILRHPEQNEAVNDKKYTIQIIEDNDELSSFIRSSIGHSYLVHESVNGLEGWKTATELIPDIIISDVMMPEMDGLELTAKIKTDVRTSHIPVILLTARSAQQHQISGLENGADIYLTKPFSIQMLELHLHNLLASRQILQERYSQKVTLEPQHTNITLPDQKFLAKIMAMIEENIANENFDVPFIASEIGMSQPVLYKKLKALTDMSVNDFVKSIRLKKAAQLLDEKQFTVYEVAYAVGFSDSKYFSKEFSKYFGVSPSVYKNKTGQ